MAIWNFGFSKSQNEQTLLFYSASVSLVTIKNRGGGKGKNLPHPMYVCVDLERFLMIRIFFHSI